MKLNRLGALWILGASSLALLNGCFSAVARMGDGWGGGQASTGTKVAAGVADVATAPIQAPALVLGGIIALGDKREQARYEAMLAAVRKNPSVALSWDLTGNEYSSEVRAVRMAFFDEKVPGVTEDLLRQMSQKSPTLENYIFAHPAISEKYIRDSFDDILRRASKGQSYALPAMIKNPNMPTDLLVRVATAELPYSTYDKILARGELERRGAIQAPEQKITPVTSVH